MGGKLEQTRQPSTSFITDQNSFSWSFKAMLVLAVRMHSGSRHAQFTSALETVLLPPRPLSQFPQLAVPLSLPPVPILHSHQGPAKKPFPVPAFPLPLALTHLPLLHMPVLEPGP